MRAGVEDDRGDSMDTIQHDNDLEDEIRSNGNRRMASGNDWFTQT